MKVLKRAFKAFPFDPRPSSSPLRGVSAGDGAFRTDYPHQLTCSGDQRAHSSTTDERCPGAPEKASYAFIRPVQGLEKVFLSLLKAFKKYGSLSVL